MEPQIPQMVSQGETPAADDSVRGQVQNLATHGRLEPDQVDEYSNKIAATRETFLSELPPELQCFGASVLGNVTAGELMAVQANRTPYDELVKQIRRFIDEKTFQEGVSIYADLQLPPDERRRWPYDQAQELKQKVVEIADSHQESQ